MEYLDQYNTIDENEGYSSHGNDINSNCTKDKIDNFIHLFR
jgi:hypothetical protein